MRTHYMRHFDKSYDKYKCNRCGKNYESHSGLKDHVKNSKCKIMSDFPPAQHYIDKLLAEYLQQGRKSKICFKCNKKYKAPFDCQMHVLSCVKMVIPCIKCGQEFVAYPNARLHFESCTNEGKDNKKANFIVKVKPPTDEDDEAWTYAMMLQYMREHTVDKLEALFHRFPQDALGSDSQAIETSLKSIIDLKPLRTLTTMSSFCLDAGIDIMRSCSNTFFSVT